MRPQVSNSARPSASAASGNSIECQCAGQCMPCVLAPVLLDENRRLQRNLRETGDHLQRVANDYAQSLERITETLSQALNGTTASTAPSFSFNNSKAPLRTAAVAFPNRVVKPLTGSAAPTETSRSNKTFGATAQIIETPRTPLPANLLGQVSTRNSKGLVPQTGEVDVLPVAAAASDRANSAINIYRRPTKQQTGSAKKSLSPKPRKKSPASHASTSASTSKAAVNQPNARKHPGPVVPRDAFHQAQMSAIKNLMNKKQRPKKSTLQLAAMKKSKAATKTKQSPGRGRGRPPGSTKSPKKSQEQKSPALSADSSMMEPSSADEGLMTPKSALAQLTALGTQPIVLVNQVQAVSPIDQTAEEAAKEKQKANGEHKRDPSCPTISQRSSTAADTPAAAATDEGAGRSSKKRSASGRRSTSIESNKKTKTNSSSSSSTAKASTTCTATESTATTTSAAAERAQSVASSSASSSAEPKQPHSHYLSRVIGRTVLSSPGPAFSVQDLRVFLPVVARMCSDDVLENVLDEMTTRGLLEAMGSQVDGSFELNDRIFRKTPFEQVREDATLRSHVEDYGTAMSELEATYAWLDESAVPQCIRDAAAGRMVNIR